LTRIYLVAGIGLLLAVAGAVALYRRLAGTAGRGSGRRLRLASFRGATEDLLARLGCLALMQVGHSRRIAESVGDAKRPYLFLYVCETGFEHRRQSHSWLVAAYEINHGCSRATVTAQDWLIAAAWASACRELPLAGADVALQTPVPLVALVEDADEWNARLGNGLSRWFREQPAERSWEIIPGFVVGYQTGRYADETLAELGRAAEELTKLLAK
jgi:hypothetical protein